jgi:acyl-CoA thioesterase-1
MLKKSYQPFYNPATMLKAHAYFSVILCLIVASCGNSENQDTKSNTDSATTKTNADFDPMKTILFFGNSLTAGYGLEPDEAFPALIQDKIDSLDLPYKVINAGLSGETSAGGKSRIDWLLKQKIDVFVLELGANDGLRGIPPTETEKNLQSIVDQVKAKYPDVKLVMAGMEVPPNMGSAYAAEFRVIFRRIAEKNDMVLVPFLLNKVGGIRELNQSDGIHPTAEGQEILAENVWEELEDIL